MTKQQKKNRIFVSHLIITAIMNVPKLYCNWVSKISSPEEQNLLALVFICLQANEMASHVLCECEALDARRFR
jgi:hypothetical protein